MTDGPPRLFTVCGSLQARSTNRVALALAARTAVDAGASVDDFEHLAQVPAFDPDRGGESIAAVDSWRHRMAASDCVLVATPEYAGAVAGAVKNAFDWLVGSGEMYRKPVALLSAGTSGGLHARRMMAQTLTWQGAYVVGELGIASAATKVRDGAIADDATAGAIVEVTLGLLAATSVTPQELVDRATAVLTSLGLETTHVTPPA